MPARRQRKCILVIVVTSSSLGIVDVIVVIVVISVIVIVVIAIGGIVVVVISASIHSLTRSGNHKLLSQTAINGNQRLPRGASVIYCTLFQFNFLSSRFFAACSYCVNTGNWLARRRYQT
jgi:flagellar basal body-associated protein FliL